MTASDELRAVKVPKTAELIAGEIRRHILRRDVNDADALPSETVLLGQFGVSRPTLREAFRILEHEGLIEVRRGAHGGARVRMPDEDVVARYAGLVLQYRGTSVGDLFDARAHIEAPGARMLASRKSRRRIVARLKESVDEQGADLLNPIRAPAFHRLVVELTGNQTLMLFTSVVEQMAVATEIAYERQNPPPLRDARQSHTAHSDFIELVRIGDPAAAEAFWYDHIVTVGSKLQKLYGGSTRAVVDIVE